MYGHIDGNITSYHFGLDKSVTGYVLLTEDNVSTYIQAKDHKEEASLFAEKNRIRLYGNIVERRGIREMIVESIGEIGVLHLS